MPGTSLLTIGFAFVTKINKKGRTALDAAKNRVEQLRVYSFQGDTDSKDITYVIARCPSIDDCEDSKNMKEQLLQTKAFYKDYIDNDAGEVDAYTFTDSNTTYIYRIKPIQSEVVEHVDKTLDEVLKSATPEIDIPNPDLELSSAELKEYT